MKRASLLITLVMGCSMAHAQWMETGNSSLNEGTDFLGNTDNVGVSFRTDDQMRMRLYKSQSNNINGYGANSILQNGYVGISNQPLFFSSTVGPFSRLHLADSCDDNPNHYAQQYGFRPWMRNGVTFTGNQDQGYVGQKYNGVLRANDSTDMILQWSDNPDYSEYGTDRLRFLFTNAKDVSKTYGAKSLEGLESFRVFVPNDTSAYVGIGDFYRASKIFGVPKDPTERLHVTDGTIRIDSLIRDYHNDTLHQVLVSDMNGKVHWRNISTWPTGGGGGGSDCDWLPSPATNRMLTAWDATLDDDDCPDEDWLIGIGTSSVYYKLDVLAKQSVGSPSGGVQGTYKGGEYGISNGVAGIVVPEDEYGAVGMGYGVLGEMFSVLDWGYGVRGNIALDNSECIDISQTGGTYGHVAASAGVADMVNGARGEVQVSGGLMSTSAGTYGFVNEAADVTAGTTLGMYGESYVRGDVTDSYGGYGKSQWITGSSLTNSFGLRGRSSSSTSGLCTYSYGVHGYASGGTNNYGVWGEVPDTSTNNWAGYFKGKLRITGNGYVSGNVLIQSDESLKTDIQDLQNASELLNALEPKTYDFNRDEHPTLNLPEGPQIGLLAQNVEQVLPQLVATVNDPAELDSLGNIVHAAEQTKAVNYIGLIPVLIGAVKEQQATITALHGEVEQMRNELAQCCHAVSPPARSVDHGSETISPLETDLRIVPNPVADRTELRYTVGTAGRVRLEITDQTGRIVRTQDEGSREAAAYVYAWDTTMLAAGTYFCTLYVNDEPLVKKAVKLAVR